MLLKINEKWYSANIWTAVDFRLRAIRAEWGLCIEVISNQYGSIKLLSSIMSKCTRRMIKSLMWLHTDENSSSSAIYIGYSRLKNIVNHDDCNSNKSKQESFFFLPIHVYEKRISIFSSTIVSKKFPCSRSNKKWSQLLKWTSTTNNVR